MIPVTWEPYADEDKPYVLALHVAQESRLGRKFEFPDLGKRPIFSSWVGRTAGRITHCVFLEAEAEFCAVGGPLSDEALSEVVPHLVGAAQFYDLRIVRSFVPVEALTPSEQGRSAAVCRILNKAQFTRENESIASFYRRIPSLEAV